MENNTINKAFVNQGPEPSSFRSNENINFTFCMENPNQTFSPTTICWKDSKPDVLITTLDLQHCSVPTEGLELLCSETQEVLDIGFYIVTLKHKSFSVVVMAAVIMGRIGRKFAQQNTPPIIRHQLVLVEDPSFSFSYLSMTQI